MGENPNVDTGLQSPKILLQTATMHLKTYPALLENLTVDRRFDPATDRKYWYNPASASSVYDEPESLSAAVKLTERKSTY